MLVFISKLISTFFGIGLISKKAPGTVGSMAASILCILLYKFFPDYFSFSAFIMCFLVGLISCYIYISRSGESSLDPGYIVIDEVAAIFLGAIILCYWGIASITDLVINFVLFRIFDIWKPFPIRNVEAYFKKQNMYGAAVGIMVDDVLAILIACILQIGFYVFF